MSERLEEIINKRYESIGLNKFEIDWVVEYAKEQAEQVERLKVKNTKLKNQKRKFMDKATWQRKEKQRYREALKFYADEDNYEHDVVEIIDGVYGVSNCEILNDEGETAIEALESESE